MLNLIKLNLHSDEILEFLKKTISFKEVYQKVSYQKIINQAAQERGITVTEEEIQAEAERLRREKHLEKAADTLAWLEEEMITPNDWEAGIRDQLLSKKLAEHLFAEEVEKSFAQNRLAYEQILLYQIVVPFERIAQEIFYQIEEQEISFYEAAHLYDIDEKRRHQCGYEGRLYRWSIEPDIEAVVFRAQPKEIVGPIPSDQGYHLYMVEEFISATLTPEKYQEILSEMFNEWLKNELTYLIHNIE